MARLICSFLFWWLTFVSLGVSLRPRAPPVSTLFPYTTLFRSAQDCLERARVHLCAPSRPRSRACDKIEGVSKVLEILTPDRKSTRLNSSHVAISYAVFCLKKKKQQNSLMNHHHKLAHRERL